jgi:hypothetical protein
MKAGIAVRGMTPSSWGQRLECRQAKARFRFAEREKRHMVGMAMEFAVSYIVEKPSF